MDRNYILASAGKKNLTAAPKLVKQDPFDLGQGGVGTASNWGIGGTTTNPYTLDPTPSHGNHGGNNGGTGVNQRGFAGDLKRLRNGTVSQEIQDIINRQGHTDPQGLNLMLSDIGRGTENSQAQLQGSSALVGGSGVLAALNAAIAQGGQEGRTRAIANENQLAEERKRQDILNLVLGPLERRAGRKAQLKAAQYAGQQGGSGFDIGGLIGAIAPLLKNLNTGNNNTGGSGLYDEGIGASNGQQGGIGYNNGTGWEI